MLTDEDRQRIRREATLERRIDRKRRRELSPPENFTPLTIAPSEPNLFLPKDGCCQLCGSKLDTLKGDE
jgi:hypothetical protein